MEKAPDAFRTISEVADWLGTPAHVLRFWESKFAQVKPIKRAGGRRYYRPSDMALLGGLKKLLHEDGMSIKGAQALIREQGIKHVAAMSPPIDDHAPPDTNLIELTVEPVAEPREIRGLPPLILRTAESADAPEAEVPTEVADEAEAETDPEPAKADSQFELPFLHRSYGEHLPQARPDRAPMLRSAPEALDAQSEAVPAEEAPASEPEPLGVPRLAELRAAALSPGLDPDRRATLVARLEALRDRMSTDRAS